MLLEKIIFYSSLRVTWLVTEEDNGSLGRAFLMLMLSAFRAMHSVNILISTAHTLPYQCHQYES